MALNSGSSPMGPRGRGRAPSRRRRRGPGRRGARGGHGPNGGRVRAAAPPPQNALSGIRPPAPRETRAAGCLGLSARPQQRAAAGLPPAVAALDRMPRRSVRLCSLAFASRALLFIERGGCWLCPQTPPFWPLYDGRGAVSKWDAARRLGGTPRAPGVGGAAIDRRARGCPPAPRRRGRRTCAYVSLSGRGTGVSYAGLLVSLQAASWRISRKPETHSLPAAFAITHVRRGALHQLLRLVVQFRLPSALCPSVLPAAKSTDHRSANSKQKCPTF